MSHEDLVTTLRQRLERVQARVAAAAARAGRDPAAVTIVGVTKRHPLAVIDAGHDAGIRHVGESYAQELVAKRDGARCAGALTWHFIGKLQRNKAKLVVGRAALVHAVDSIELAREIDKRAAQAQAQAGQQALPLPGGKQRVLVAVNLSGEPQKSGVAPERAGEVLAAVAELDHVACAGLMTMPPLASRPEDNRPYFRRLAELRASLGDPGLTELSMGTTDDFEVAVEEGATLVRIGTALFGPRPT